MDPATNLIHASASELMGSTPLVNPVYHSVKYCPKNYAHFNEILKNKSAGYIYSRVANPTVRELEMELAKFQGREDALCFSSGIAAITAAVMGLCKSGDHIVMFRESYKPTRFLVSKFMEKFGVTSDVISMHESDRLESVLKTRKTKLVIFESPTNPVVRLVDIVSLTNLCKKHLAMVVCDNTFAGFSHHGQFPIDIFVHSLTKHACGHSDAMGGVLIASQSVVDSIFPYAVTLGATLDPHAAFLIARGLKTYHLRTKEASLSAASLATWLSKDGRVERVRYPGLESHPEFNLCQSQMGGDGGSVICFDLLGDMEKFFDRLKLFKLTPSMGCVESLVAPCYQLFADDLGPALAKESGITEKTVRLAVGVENKMDLLADLEQALRHC
jgi:cystathionine beta-lyase/cystathionine gamma-synthase